ncbi:MAG: site-specific integrase [Pseudomonadota bacterium]
MSYRLPAHLHRNRHGMLYFRLAIPNDIRILLGQREIYRSLRTSSVRQAADSAQALRIVFAAFFKRLRTLPMSEKEKSASEAWDEFVQSPDLRQLINNAGKKIAIEEQQIQLDMREAEIANLLSEQANENARHEHTLSVVIKAKSDNLAPDTITVSDTITAIWELYKAERIAMGTAGGWKDGEHSAKYHHWPHIRDFINLIGDKPIASVTVDDVEKFQKFILADRPAEESASNKNKRLLRVGGLFRWAKVKRKINDSFAEFFRYPGKAPKNKNNYLKFSSEDIKVLFEADEYRNNLFKTPSEYWIPLLGLFTGGRLNEIAQLTVLDISTVDGIKTISILDGDGKRLKNNASRRIIPIHSKLLELGFMDFVKSIGKDNKHRLFPELKASKSKAGDYGKEPSRKFTAYRRRMNIGGDELNPTTGKWEGKNRKVFHSFRSTLISALRTADVPKDRRTRLAGHEYSDTQDGNYDGGDTLTMFSIKTLQADIESVFFDAEFTPYDPKSHIR